MPKVLQHFFGLLGCVQVEMASTVHGDQIYGIKVWAYVSRTLQNDVT